MKGREHVSQSWFGEGDPTRKSVTAWWRYAAPGVAVTLMTSPSEMGGNTNEMSFWPGLLDIP